MGVHLGFLLVFGMVSGVPWSLVLKLSINTIESVSSNYQGEMQTNDG